MSWVTSARTEGSTTSTIASAVPSSSRVVGLEHLDRVLALDRSGHPAARRWTPRPRAGARPPACGSRPAGCPASAKSSVPSSRHTSRPYSRPRLLQDVDVLVHGRTRPTAPAAGSRRRSCDGDVLLDRHGDDGLRRQARLPDGALLDVGRQLLTDQRRAPATTAHDGDAEQPPGHGAQSRSWSRRLHRPECAGHERMAHGASLRLARRVTARGALRDRQRATHDPATGSRLAPRSRSRTPTPTARSIVSSTR